MAAEVERQAVQCPQRPKALTTEERDTEGMSVLAGEVGLVHPSSKARVQFGDALTQQRPPKQEAARPLPSEAEVR